MTDETKCGTDGCAGNPRVPGSAGGLCPRCYQRKRRGLKPAAESTIRGNLSETVSVRLSPRAKRAARAFAKRLGLKLTPWIEHLIVSATGVR